ncbi:MAG TPA: hypothetical protein VK116_09745, partial [Planctomycetota bacterium]|nr:hypothetical protein [Planctomycetota bacterium]
SLFAAAAGAFSLIKRRTYDAIGGHQAIRLAVVDDIWLARHVRSAGFRTEARHGEGLLEVEYAGSFADYLRVSEKNAFALFRYRISVASLVTLGTLVIHTVGPIALICVPATWAPAIVVWASIAIAYWPVARTLTEASAHPSSAELRRTPFWCFIFHPFYAAWSALAIARSMSATLRRGGVRWRDRIYSLAELRAWHREEERALRLRSSPGAASKDSK